MNRGHKRRDTPAPAYKPLGWKIHACFLGTGGFLLVYASQHLRRGKLEWRNWLRQPIFAGGVLVLGVFLIVLGAVPWDYLNRRFADAERRKQRDALYRTARKF